MLYVNIDTSLPFKDPVLIFSLMMFIILFAPILLQKLRLPSIVGLIIAGVIVGPFGLNILERTTAIELFGTVGLLYIMFIAALEMDLSELYKNSSRSIVFGMLTFIVPIAIGFPVCIYVLNYSFTASVLVASMFATHTLVAYPLLNRLGVTRNIAVTTAVGGTILTDSLVLLILAIVVALHNGVADAAFWFRLVGLLAVYVTMVFYLFPKIGRWFFNNIEGEKSSHYIFVLAMVFLSAFLAKVAGVEPIIGAFLAGLAFNRLIPKSSPLMNRIEFVGHAIFIPFFLLSVGMLVDVKVLLEGPETIIAAVTLTIVAIIGKYVAALITQRIFKFSALQRNIIFGLSSSHAAATIAVILIGYNMGILDKHVLNGTILLILITCLVSSFVTERAGKKLALENTAVSTDIPDVSEKILVSIENPKTIEGIIDFAILMKNPYSKEPIIPFSVVKDDHEAKEKIALSRKKLDKAMDHASASDCKVQVVARVDLNVVTGIIRTIKELNVSDVLLGWSDRIKPTDRIFGTILENVLHRTHQMIFVCNIQHSFNAIKRIIVVVPPNAEAEAGFTRWLNKVKRIGRHTGARVYFYANTKSIDALKIAINRFTLGLNTRYVEHGNWDDLQSISEDVSRDDLVLVVSARKGTVSYAGSMENLSVKLSKVFYECNLVIIYPDQKVFLPEEKMAISTQSSEDVEITVIKDNVERFNKLYKSLIAKRKENG